MLKTVIVLLCVQCGCTFLVKYMPEVQVSESILRGFRGLDGLNRFFGIPYAVSKRFQAPHPPRKWSGVFEATRRYESCPQTLFVQIGTEDCLKLDIYTPEHVYRGQNLPVLVFFHGGAYFLGAKWNYSPEFLVQKNVIVVLPNYRLGALGFLCLNNVANLGLKDQVAALKWIQKNIAAFGGDPNNVTLSGHSAGASSASMHLLSKRSKNLFHKAIFMSGNMFNPWAFTLNPQTPAYEDAGKSGTVQSDETDVYNIFLKASLNDLLTMSQDTLTDPRYFKYSPCYDANLTDAFFHDMPYNIIRKGNFIKVPMIIGLTDFEGLVFYRLNNQISLDYLENTFPDRLPSTFSWCSKEDKKIIADKIRSHYFGTQRINSYASIKEAIDMYSDWMAYAATDAFSKLIVEHSDKPVYNYLYSYIGERSFVNFLFNIFGIQGTTHMDELFYLFNPGGIPLAVGHVDKLMVDRFATMLTNFMKFGDPTPSVTSLIPVRWPAITANSSRLMKIDRHLSVVDMPARVRGDFYRGLLCEHGQSGFVPCESAGRCNLNT